MYVTNKGKGQVFLDCISLVPLPKEKIKQRQKKKKIF